MQAASRASAPLSGEPQTDSADPSSFFQDRQVEFLRRPRVIDALWWVGFERNGSQRVDRSKIRFGIAPVEPFQPTMRFKIPGYPARNSCPVVSPVSTRNFHLLVPGTPGNLPDLLPGSAMRRRAVKFLQRAKATW
jgi:hypothetical protein